MANVNKVSCNTSVDAEILRQAKQFNISPSAILEEALKQSVKGAKYKQWREENKQAIDEHNEKIAEQGTFSERIGQL